MRAKRPIAVLVVLLAIGLLPASAVLAMHHPQVSDVTAAATADGMFCSPDIGQVNCSGFGPNDTYRTATVSPASGPLASLTTTVPAFQSRDLTYHMDSFDQTWNGAIHDVGCDNAAAVASYVATVAALTILNTSVAAATVGECTMSGTLSSGSIDFSPMYVITSRTLPSAFATPTPVPTQAPTATPTPTPVPTATPQPTGSPTATPKPTPTATVTLRPTATASAAPATSESASASASASASETQTATISPSATPEQSVAGARFTPEPSLPAKAPDQGVGGWPGSVPGAGDVSTDVGKVGGSAMAALLMLAAMGFIGELFNNTMATNYARIINWWKKSWVGRIGRGLGGLFGGGS
jgi:hypothetical protein